MIKEFRYAYVIRKKLIDLVQSLSVEQLNTIPKGFNNNIAWHFGHLLVSTEILCYVRSGVMPEKRIEFAEQYKNGSRPETFIPQEEINFITAKMLSSLDDIELDYHNGVFQGIVPYSTHTFGFEIKTIEEVFECCAYHDTVHWGNVLAMKKLV